MLKTGLLKPFVAWALGATLAAVALPSMLAAVALLSMPAAFGLPGLVGSAAAQQPYVLGETLKGSQADTGSAPGSGEAKPDSPANAPYKETDWDSLVPEDWDPMKAFGELDFSQMSDSDPRAISALAKLRDAWRNAPVNADVDKSRIRIPGFVVPLDNGKGPLKEFLLVPYFGACIHVPPPPSNQVIHVVVADRSAAAKGGKGERLRTMSAVWVSGTLSIEKTDTAMGSASYRMSGDMVEPYAEKPGAATR